MTRFAGRPVLAVVALKSALDLAFANRYGWQRDELYYAVAGKHLQGGYVEFPPVTALLSACARFLFGYSLVGFRVFPVVAGALEIVVAALVARELGGGRRAQVIAAIGVGFSPVVLATNGLFQPVSFDSLATMVVLWLALRLALGRGSWTCIGLAVGIGLETKYTLAIPLILLVASFTVWRRDALQPAGVARAAAIAAVLLVPNLIWEAQHDWVSVHFFVHPPGSATDETRPKFLLDLVLDLNVVALPLLVAGITALHRDRIVRPLAWTVAGTAIAYFALGGKSYYAAPALLFALAAGAVPFARWASPRRLGLVAVPFVLFFVVALPNVVPVLPLKTANAHGVIKDRSDYQDEIGWPQLTRTVEQHATGADLIFALNYGEAGALDVFGRGLPPVATADVTFRYWRPAVSGRSALLVGLARSDATFCTGYRVVARIEMPVQNEERGRPIARCELTSSLAQAWPSLVRRFGE
jgi:4-amino-4-deoxy-L-arabinose transferase-like glycosyltransferase